MTDDLVLVGNHAEALSNGSQIAPGDRVRASELGDEDQYLVDEGRLIPDPGPQGGAPTKAELLARAGDLNIEGRSKMTVDELAAAVAAAEAETGGTA